MGQFLDVDLPYRVDTIQPHRDLLNFMPKMIHVDTVTNLSLNSPAATGYLVFEKSNFGNSVIDELENPE